MLYTQKYIKNMFIGMLELHNMSESVSFVDEKTGWDKPNDCLSKINEIMWECDDRDSKYIKLIEAHSIQRENLKYMTMETQNTLGTFAKWAIEQVRCEVINQEAISAVLYLSQWKLLELKNQMA